MPSSRTVKFQMLLAAWLFALPLWAVKAPSITTTSFPQGQNGVAYSATVQGRWGVKPYAWTISAGSLPNGLTLGAVTGVISGTPTVSNTFSFTIRLTDAGARTYSRSFYIVIAGAVPPAVPPVQISTSTVPNGVVGSTYTTQFQALNGTTPYAWSASGTVPAGTTLNSSTGVLSGTPTTAGTDQFAITVLDSSTPSTTASQSYVAQIAAASGLQAGCGAYTDNSLCGPVGNAYAAFPGGLQPAANTTILACGTYTSPSPNYVYRVGANIGADAAASCLLFNYGNTFILDLNGKTVTGSINDNATNWGDKILNGTVTCNGNPYGGVLAACIAVNAPGTTPNGTIEVHHVTLVQQGAGAFCLFGGPPGKVGTSSGSIDFKVYNSTCTVPSQPTNLSRSGFVGITSLNFMTTEVYNLSFTCPADVAACQGVVVTSYPGSSLHNNNIVAQHPTFNTGVYAVARPLMFDCEGHIGAWTCGGSTIAYNTVTADDSLGIRVRGEAGDIVHDNIIYNIRHSGIHIGDTDNPSEGTSVEAYSNTLEVNDGIGIACNGAASTTCNVHNNTLTCYLGTCANWFARADNANPGYAHPINAAALTIKNNTMPAALPVTSTILSCGPAGNPSYVCGIPDDTASVTWCNNSGYTPVGNGTITQTCP